MTHSTNGKPTPKRTAAIRAVLARRADPYAGADMAGSEQPSGS
jgi:hypothetical protein